MYVLGAREEGTGSEKSKEQVQWFKGRAQRKTRGHRRQGVSVEPKGAIAWGVKAKTD